MANRRRPYAMADLYRNSDHVQMYASCRPNYPQELFYFVASKAPAYHLAWDVGTGGGQAAASLAELFESVVATDCSPEQISHAPSNLLNARFIVTPPSLNLIDLHRLVAPPGSVDLITVAMALHWFDIPAFFEQAKAVLRNPGGVLAVWCYDYRLVVDRGRVDEIYRRLGEEMWAYLLKETRVLVEEGYAGIEFPFKEVEGVEEGTKPVRGFVAEKEMTVDGLISFTRTWAGYQKAKEAGVELLTEEVVDGLTAAWGEDGKELKAVRFPISLRIGRM